MLKMMGGWESLLENGVGDLGAIWFAAEKSQRITHHMRVKKFSLWLEVTVAWSFSNPCAGSNLECVWFVLVAGSVDICTLTSRVPVRCDGINVAVTILK